ncbi:MAG: hypothetical protein M3N53_11425 [Actinomycetota bacterium]|nr:hypothetical protein [Actinomycetota bacterium]
MTRYQIVLLFVLAAWPFAILGLLFLMSRLETYVKRIDAQTPEEAGLEPVSGTSNEREVQIFVGDRIVGEPK